MSEPCLPSAGLSNEAKESETLHVVLLGAPGCLPYLLGMLCSQQTCSRCTDCLKAGLPSEAQ